MNNPAEFNDSGWMNIILPSEIVLLNWCLITVHSIVRIIRIHGEYDNHALSKVLFEICKKEYDDTIESFRRCELMQVFGWAVMLSQEQCVLDRANWLHRRDCYLKSNQVQEFIPILFQFPSYRLSLCIRRNNGNSSVLASTALDPSFVTGTRTLWWHPLTVLLNSENICVLKPIFAYVSNSSGRINFVVIVNVFHPVVFVCDRCMFPRKSLDLIAKGWRTEWHAIHGADQLATPAAVDHLQQMNIKS